MGNDNKTEKQGINMFWHTHNTKNERFRAKKVLYISDYLIKNSATESIYKSNFKLLSVIYTANALS